MVVGGHTHETQFHDIIQTGRSYFDAFFSQPQVHKDRHVFVTQCGSDGDYVGKIELDVVLSRTSEKMLRVSSATRDLISSSKGACVPYVQE